MSKEATARSAISAERAMKLALEALSPWAGEDANHTEQYAAYHAIREALAEQETVLPGGGHVPAVPVAVYGYCPECGGAGVMRERRPNGDDKCTNGHKYPSSKALAEQPAQRTWVGLTDYEIDAAIHTAKKVDTGYVGWVRDQRREYARAIEAKLKEKNQ